jgi:hypothetical protein
MTTGAATQSAESPEQPLAQGPHRACRLVLDAQGDSPEALARELRHLAARIERGEASRGCSGASSGGTIYELVVGDRPTHDEYFAQIDAYLLGRKQQA